MSVVAGTRPETERKRKGKTRVFVEDFLSSNPGSLASQVIAKGRERNFSRSTIYNTLNRLVTAHVALRAGGRFWLGSVSDPDIAVAHETDRLIATLSSKQYSEKAKIDAARQLARESRVGRPMSQETVELIRLLPSQSVEIREALLPYLYGAVRASVQARFDDGPIEAGEQKGTRRSTTIDVRYARDLWAATETVIREFLLDPEGSGTIAWNTVYEAVNRPGLLGDGERTELARRAIEVESATPLEAPSAARAVLRRIARDAWLRDQLRDDVLVRLSTAKRAVESQQLGRLLEDLDIRAAGESD